MNAAHLRFQPLGYLVCIAVLLCLILLAQYSHADICEDNTARSSIYRQQGIDPKKRLQDCIVLPHDPSRVVLAAADLIDKGAQSGQTYRLHLFLLDAQSGQLVAQISKPETSLTQFKLLGLRIHPYSYQLNPKHFAVAIKLSFDKSYQANTQQLKTLSLYVLEQQRQVLDRLVIHHYLYEWDGQCTEKYQRDDTILKLLKAKQHDYHHLSFRTDSTGWEIAPGKMHRCSLRQAYQKPNRVTLRYDGEQYQIPESKRASYAFEQFDR